MTAFHRGAVYEDGAALARQESAPEVHRAMALFDEALRRRPSERLGTTRWTDARYESDDLRTARPSRGLDAPVPNRNARLAEARNRGRTGRVAEMASERKDDVHTAQKRAMAAVLL